MKYALKIEQTADGETSVVAVDAIGEMCGGVLILQYSFDGAEYILEIAQNQMSQTRRGEVSLNMHFAEGKQSFCRLGDGTHVGGFEIFTERLSVTFDGENCRAECIFTGGADKEVTSLTVQANLLFA